MVRLELACLPQIMNRVLPEKPSNLGSEAKRNRHWVGLLAAGCKTGNCTKTFVTFSLEQDLAPKFLGVFVIPKPELALSPVDIAGLQLDRNSLIWLSGNNEILVVWVGFFNPLLVCAHNTDLGGYARGEIRKLELE